jgi:hypothetical protein
MYGNGVKTEGFPKKHWRNGVMPLIRISGKSKAGADTPHLPLSGSWPTL